MLQKEGKRFRSLSIILISLFYNIYETVYLDFIKLLILSHLPPFHEQNLHLASSYV